MGRRAGLPQSVFFPFAILSFFLCTNLLLCSGSAFFKDSHCFCCRTGRSCLQNENLPPQSQHLIFSNSFFPALISLPTSSSSSSRQPRCKPSGPSVFPSLIRIFFDVILRPCPTGPPHNVSVALPIVSPNCFRSVYFDPPSSFFSLTLTFLPRSSLP